MIFKINSGTGAYTICHRFSLFLLCAIDTCILINTGKSKTDVGDTYDMVMKILLLSCFTDAFLNIGMTPEKKKVPTAAH